MGILSPCSSAATIFMTEGEVIALGKGWISLVFHLACFVWFFNRPGAADKGPGDAASARRQPQHAEEAGRAGEEALPDRGGHQNFLEAQGLHQAGRLSRWGWVCCAALREHPSSLGRDDHHFGREGEEGKFRTLGPRRCRYSVQRAAGISCSPSSAVSCPRKREGDTLIHAPLCGLENSCLCAA